MPKIDAMLRMMGEKNVERAVLRSDKPYEIFLAGRRIEGAVTPQAQLQQILEEVVPASLAPMLSSGSTFYFQHQSQFGAFDIGVANDIGALQVTLTRAATGAVAMRSQETPSFAPAPPVAPQTPGAPPGPVAIVPTTPPPFQPNAGAPAWPQNPLPNYPPQTPSPGYPQQQAPPISQPQGYPQQGQQPQSYPTQGYPPPNYPPQGPPQQGYPQQNYPPQGYPQHGQNPQGYPALPYSPHQPPSYPMFHGPAIGDKSPRSKSNAALLAFFFPGLGLHRFYLGYTAIGVIYLLVSFVLGLFTCGIAWGISAIVSHVECIIILCNGIKDFEGRELS